MDSNTNITLTIKFFANFRELGPAKSKEQHPKGTLVKTILDKYRIPYNEMNPKHQRLYHKKIKKKEK